ncbi:hypothetical protein DM860_011641 [Cuscuta australis]|uniref:Protein kinase domain-containing protein n=1 Tax=Cuscuta australis TaxID=267555 RepID=A0A328DFS6_9ASTE|nr:hypothetical protein DM860_011641 [Cuscuta australis]
MKDPDSVRQNTSKIKIVVSFNGTFRRRPPEGRLRYTGGESKIISVDQSISFSRLKARIFDLMVEANGGAAVTSAFSLRYHLPDSQEDRPLVPVSSDEDVSSMFHEFLRLDYLGKPTRLWVFVCFDDLNSPPDFNAIPLKKTMNGKNNGFGGEKGKRMSDNSLRKLVLKQQLLGKKSDRVRVLKGETGNTEKGFPVVDISSKNCYGQFGPRDTTRSLGILHKPHQELCRMEDFHTFGLLDNNRPYNIGEWENLGCGPLKDTLEGTILASMADVSLKNVSLSSSPSTKFEQKIPSPSRMEDESPPLERSPQPSSPPHKAMDPIVDKFPISLSCDEQGENTETNKCARANNGTILADGGLCCTHVGNGRLQRINRYELEYVKELGCGTYGTVYYGKWKGSDVAIKRLKPSCFADGTMEDRLVADFWKEAQILGSLHHPNIVALYGVVTDGLKNNLETVTEYMVNGSLKQVLRKRDGTIDYRKRLLIALDAAFGLEYLHQKNVIHFDLKSHNFLVNMRDPQRPICKIGDLGLSKIRQRTLVSGGVRGTLPWMAPELLNGESMVSEKVDVYSFGIVMWELLTGAEPYSNMRAEEVICGIIKGSLRPEIPNWCHPGWRYLMEKCWASDPRERPAFSDIARELRAMASSMNII